MDQEKKDEHQLSMEDLDQVAGGKQREDREIFKAIQLNTKFRTVLYKNYGNNDIKGWIKGFKDLLGVKMKWGYGSVTIPNQYWDSKSGKRISHEAFLERIAGWRPDES